MKLGLKINKKTLLKMAAGMLAVKVAPTILTKIFPKNPSLTTGLTGDLIAGGVGLGVGVVMKDEVIQTVAVATALTEIANTQVQKIANELIPAETQNPNGTNTPRLLNNFTHLRDYPRRVALNRSYSNYYGN